MHSKLNKKFEQSIQIFNFDFDSALSAYNETNNKNWKPLREGIDKKQTIYPVIIEEFVSTCHMEVRNQIIPMIRNTFPSLADTDKLDPSDDWIPESDS